MKHIFLWQQFKQLDTAYTLRKYQLETCDEVADELISSLSDYEVCVNGTKQAFNKVKQDIQNRLNERTDRVGSFNMYIDIMNIDIDSRIGNRTLWEWAKAMDKIDKDDKLEEFLLKYKKEFHKTYFKTIFASDFTVRDAAMYIDNSSEMIYNNELYYCVEVSGIIEHYFKKHNGYPIPNTIASNILQVSDNLITLSKKDMFHYDRVIGQDGEKFTKMIYGMKSEEIFQEVMSDFEDNYDFMKEVNKMVGESKETKYSVRQAIYIIENLYTMHEDNALNELIPKWHDALRDSMEVLYSTKERTQTISNYIEYGEYLLSDMQVLTLNVISLTTIEYGKHTNHDETPSNIHTEPLCEIARINVCESGNGLFPYNKWELKVYSNDHTPPHFHVIADGWDVSFKIDNGELLVVNRKGSNDTIYQYMIDNIPKWLEANCAVLPIATNKQNANAVWKQIHAMTDDFSSKHRIDEMATISRPADNFPRQSKVVVYGENDEQGTNTPHFHVQIDNGDIELEVKFSNIRDMEILYSSNNSKSWDGIEDVRDKIIEWLDEISVRNYGLTNLERMIMSWNDCNPENEIGKKFIESSYYIDHYIDVSGCLCNFFKRYIDDDKIFLYGSVGLHKDRFIIKDKEIYNKILFDIEDYYRILDSANKIDDIIKRSIYIIEYIYLLNEENGLDELAPKWYEAFLESMNVLRNVDSNCVIGVGGGYQTILDYIEYGEYLLLEVKVLKLEYGEYGIG